MPRIPSVDEILRTDAAGAAIARFGRPPRSMPCGERVEAVRDARAASGQAIGCSAPDLAAAAAASSRRGIAAEPAPRVQSDRHGAAHQPRPRAAGRGSDCGRRRRHALGAWRWSSTSAAAARGERDDHVRGLLRELTGAEDATIVNNNAAAVLLVLNTLGDGKEAVVSRGELIEIGGVVPHARHHGARRRASGRGRHHQPHPPEGLRAGDRRRHRADPQGAHLELPDPGLHQGGAGAGARLSLARGSAACRSCTTSAPARWSICARYGLAHEPTVAEALAEGADLVTFSGDKLLGGPQAGFIAGRKDLVARDRQEPDEARAARRQDPAGGAGGDAEALSRSRPAARDAADAALLRAPARPRSRLPPSACAEPVATAVGPGVHGRTVVACASQIGSGALPLETLPSAGLAIAPVGAQGCRPRASRLWRAAFRGLPVPVIGRIEDGALILDLRCLEDEAGFVAQSASGSSACTSASRRRGDAMIVGTAGHIDHGKTALVRRADRRRYRPPEGGEGARHLDRSRLRLLAAPGRRDPRLRRCAGARGVGAQHAGRRHRHRFRAAGRRRRRRRHAADARAPGDHRPARHRARRRRAQQVRSRRRRTGSPRSRSDDARRCWPARASQAPRSSRSRPSPAKGIDALRERLDAALTRTTTRAARAAASASPSTARSRWPGLGTAVTGTVLSGSVAVERSRHRQPVGARGPRALDPCAEPARRAGRGRAALRAHAQRAAHQQGRDRAAATSCSIRRCMRRPPGSTPACACCRPSRKPIGQWFPVKVHHAAADVPGRIVVLRDHADRRRRDRVCAARAGAADRGGRRRPLRGARHLVEPHHRRRPLIDLRAPERRRRTPERRAEIAAMAREATRRGRWRALLAGPAGWIDLDAFARDRALGADAVAACLAAHRRW